MGAAVALFACGMAAVALAEPGADTCLKALGEAGIRQGVPPSILRGLAIHESGKAQDGETLPWPWTVEVDGTRRWFSDRESALVFAGQLEERRIETYSIGCFLLASDLLRSMSIPPSGFIDPARNAEIAAQALKTLYEETGSWTEASQIFRNERGAVAGNSRSGETTARPRNGSGSGGLGSLVPISGPARQGE